MSRMYVGSMAHVWLWVGGCCMVCVHVFIYLFSVHVLACIDVFVYSYCMCVCMIHTLHVCNFDVEEYKGLLLWVPGWINRDPVLV